MNLYVKKWRDSLQVFLRYCVHKAKTVFCEVNVTSTFDHQNQIISSKWMSEEIP